MILLYSFLGSHNFGFFQYMYIGSRMRMTSADMLYTSNLVGMTSKKQGGSFTHEHSM